MSNDKTEATFHPEPKPAKPARPQATYTREQKGHSIIKHALLGWVLLWIPTIYYIVSPRHYFHA